MRKKIEGRKIAQAKFKVSHNVRRPAAIPRERASTRRHSDRTPIECFLFFIFIFSPWPVARQPWDSDMSLSLICAYLQSLYLDKNKSGTSKDRIKEHINIRRLIQIG